MYQPLTEHYCVNKRSFNYISMQKHPVRHLLTGSIVRMNQIVNEKKNEKNFAVLNKLHNFAEKFFAELNERFFTQFFPFPASCKAFFGTREVAVQFRLL